MMFASEEECVSQWRAFVPVVRASQSEVRVYPCCSVPVAVKVHWFRQRSVPCVQAAGMCPACVTPGRPLVFLGVQMVTPQGTTAPRVLELPVSAWALVKQEASAAGGLTQVSFCLRRDGGKRGRVRVDLFERVQVAGCFMGEGEIVSALCRMWDVPAPRVGELDSEWLTRVGIAIASEGHYKPK